MRRRISPDRPRLTPSGLTRMRVRSDMGVSLVRVGPHAEWWHDRPVITLSDFATFPDFPVPGVLFYDISPILADPVLFADACDAMMPDHQVDVVVGVDARGFIFAPVVAQRLNVGMSMVRKKGKMPGELLESNTTIEYGASELVLSAAGIEGKRALVIDD